MDWKASEVKYGRMIRPSDTWDSYSFLESVLIHELKLLRKVKDRIYFEGYLQFSDQINSNM
jgi:hypothetical protein